MTAKYIVVEIQRSEDGTISNLVYSYDSQNEAESQYYTILAAAAVSSIARHSAIMMSDEGFPMKYASYTHSDDEETEE